MRCSLKRSLTVLLSASLLLLLLLHGGSRQEQDPLQVSPRPGMSHWRGHWSIFYHFLPHMRQTSALLSSLSLVTPSSALSSPWAAVLP